MAVYRSSKEKITRAKYGELLGEAKLIFRDIQRRTKRRPYVRSAYFGKQKIFFDYFWIHLFQKIPPERVRRLQFFEAAVDSIRHSRHDPVSMQNPNRAREVLHRFSGVTRDGKRFIVQIKEDKRTKRLQFMSCFPDKVDK